MMNKKGIELSVNFLVMFILAMAVFALGFYIATQIAEQGDNLKFVLNSKVRQSIDEQLQKTSKRFLIHTHTIELRRKEQGFFAYGILNKVGSQSTFTIQTQCKSFAAPGQDPTQGCDLSLSTTPDVVPPASIELTANDRKVDGIGVLISKEVEPGDYTILLTVKEGANDYDKQIVYIVVPTR